MMAKTVSAITAAILDSIQGDLERQIIDKLCVCRETVSDSEFRDYAVSGVLEIIALRKVIHSLKVRLEGTSYG